MPICQICDEAYEPSDRDLPSGFCEHCAEAVDNKDFFTVLLQNVFDAECVEVIFHA